MNRSAGPLRLTWLHTRYQVLETLRVPVVVVSTAVFPALIFTVFVVPQASAMDPSPRRPRPRSSRCSPP